MVQTRLVHLAHQSGQVGERAAAPVGSAQRGGFGMDRHQGPRQRRVLELEQWVAQRSGGRLAGHLPAVAKLPEKELLLGQRWKTALHP